MHNDLHVHIRTYVSMHNMYVYMYICTYVIIIHIKGTVRTVYSLHIFCIVVVIHLPSSPSAGMLIAEMTTMVVMSMAGFLIAVICLHCAHNTTFSPTYVALVELIVSFILLG